jgi:hypothetical protein
MGLGSRRGFVYTDDLGESYVIQADESNTEAANGAAAAAPTLGAPVRNGDGNLRSAVYRNAVTGATRTVVVLTEAALLLLPVVLNFLSATAGSAGAAEPYALVRTRGHKGRRYGGDSGLLDGDFPG